MAWEFVEGRGIWQKWKNTTTGEESIELHTPKVVKQWCGSHEFDSYIPRNRILTCKKCGQEVLFIVGYHELKQGKLLVRSR